MATATAVSATGTTNGICQKSGPYKTTRNPSLILFFRSGQRFPVDPVDGRSTTWSMIGATGTQATM